MLLPVSLRSRITCCVHRILFLLPSPCAELLPARPPPVLGLLPGGVPYPAAPPLHPGCAGWGGPRPPGGGLHILRVAWEGHVPVFGHVSERRENGRLRLRRASVTHLTLGLPRTPGFFRIKKDSFSATYSSLNYNHHNNNLVGSFVAKRSCNSVGIPPIAWKFIVMKIQIWLLIFSSKVPYLLLGGVTTVLDSLLKFEKKIGCYCYNFNHSMWIII